MSFDRISAITGLSFEEIEVLSTEQPAAQEEQEAYMVENPEEHRPESGEFF